MRLEPQDLLFINASIFYGKYLSLICFEIIEQAQKSHIRIHAAVCVSHSNCTPLTSLATVTLQ